MNEPATSAPRGRWAGAWPDALAFTGGLAVAWFGGWDATDLVWSLWLSSLTVGFAMIFWVLSRPLRELLGGMSRDRMAVPLVAKGAVAAVFGLGTLLGLAFFAVHFGGFHYVHSVFLNQFFPIEIAGRPERGFPTAAIYAEVIRRYWLFLPVAFLAERAAFRPPVADTAVDAAAIARRKAAGEPLMLPYRNVIRMHLLIFFFAFAHFAKLENFAVYAVVYAVYFFPWRLLTKTAPSAVAVVM